MALKKPFPPNIRFPRLCSKGVYGRNYKKGYLQRILKDGVKKTYAHRTPIPTPFRACCGTDAGLCCQAVLGLAARHHVTVAWLCSYSKIRCHKLVSKPLYFPFIFSSKSTYLTTLQHICRACSFFEKIILIFACKRFAILQLTAIFRHK